MRRTDASTQGRDAKTLRRCDARRLLVLAAILVTSVTPSLAAQITRAEYQARRDSLAARIGNGVVVAFGGRTPVSDFGPFYQAPAFRYLTGYQFADAAMVMVVRGGKGTSTLFVNKSTPRRALYYGEEPDSAALVRDLGLGSRAVGDLTAVADSLAAAGLPVFGLRDFEDADFAPLDSLTRGGQFLRGLAARHPGLAVSDAHPIVDQLRANKSEAELALLRKAAEISAEGHAELMRRIEPGMHEYDLQAIVEYAFRRGGAERPAYGSIVGAGPNGTQLHYMKDRREIKAGEVVVIDAAGEYDGYAADVTRTIPVSGTYSREQRALYQVVRDGQAAAERNSKPGLSIQAAQDSSLDVRAKGLAALGLIESATATFDPPWPVDCAKNPRGCQQVSLFAIHGISHGLGLAVHDPLQAYYGDKTFKKGDAFTIEPGVYVTTKLLDILPDTPRNRAFKAKVQAAVLKYQDTGVRIEDDYIITDQGLEWITHAPREIDEIEALYKQRKRPIP
ncbi:MAG TPA: aminopeptidase P N-terminal domain-containing protein [Gemmatimonadales bacterium]|nr:aminopeptidase P N-terminal domain-containing protein [Gemmatimonadales bacterium]